MTLLLRRLTRISTLAAALLGLATVVTPARAVTNNLFVPDTTTGNVSMVTPDGTVSIFASGFSFPAAVAYKNDYHLMVSDFFANTVYELNSSGQAYFFASVPNPASMAFDSTGNLYVVQPSGGKVSQISSGGNVTDFVTGLSFPSGIAIDASNNLYVADMGTNKLVKIYANTTVDLNFASGFNTPLGVAISLSGNIFVANGGNGTISMITPGGSASNFITGITNADGLAFDAFDNLYVGTSPGGDVFKITPGGNQTLFASGFGDPRGIGFGPIPEPTTVALGFGLGAAAFAAIGRLRRRK